SRRERVARAVSPPAACRRAPERRRLPHRQGQGPALRRARCELASQGEGAARDGRRHERGAEVTAMRNTCLNMVYELAKRDPRPVFIGSDLSPGLLKEMKRDYPERWYMEGVTEANVIGMAAGMAMEGYIPYVNTIATFITRRCYEQVAVDLCLHDLPVRLIGNGGGLVYAPLGPTHLAIEDMAIMRVLPNMAVVAVCDAEEMKSLM